MRPKASLFAVLTATLLIAAAPARADFGLHGFDVVFTGPPAPGAEPGELGPVVSGAGAHPYAMTTSFRVNGEDTGEGGELPDQPIRTALFAQMPGFAAAPTATPTCSAADFLTRITVGGEFLSNCPNSAAVGVTASQLANRTSKPIAHAAVYNLEPPPGVTARFGFWTAGVPVTVDGRVSEAPPYLALAEASNISQLVEVLGSEFTLWGVPADPRHDSLRGRCITVNGNSTGNCSVGVAEKPFVTMPRACEGPLTSTYEAVSWAGEIFDGGGNLIDDGFDEGSALTHNDAGAPQGMIGCGALGLAPSIAATPTAKAAQSPTGLDFALAVHDEGITNPAEGATAGSDIRKAVVTLPEGMTINPSQAEGLEVCSEADLARESAQSAPGVGCPQASKIGTIEVETPLLEGELLKGSLFVAEPYANLAGDSLIAFYIVIKHPSRGVLVTQAARVEPDPRTGQLITTTENMPQLPFSDFRLHFREGGRSPLVTPPGCGSYDVKAQLYPWSGGAPVESISTFQIVSGPNNGPCPSGDTPPFEPGFSGGTLNNAAGAYSPFLLRLQRRDGDQDLVRFDSTLPPGALAKLAGVGRCSDAQIAQIKARTGKEELASSSCPASSKIGSVQAGAGVGSQLTYVPGSVYLAGPFGGAPLSVVGVVPAVAGPFDVGVVMTRQALVLDPRTGQAKVDGSLSDPIPHILAGIPLKVRDIQVSVDRPDFTLNPTNCNPLAFGAEIWGGGADAFSLADDAPVSRSERFQAADCASLGFKPRLNLQLKGATRRGGFPALRGTFLPRAGDANLKGLTLRLPHSAFLEQSHIRTICTRVQFAARSCPKGAIYGHARAFTPLLDEPLEGPVYLRSSSNPLPDFVADLHGLVDIEAVARIDSKNGGIRATFLDTPDAPLTKVVVSMQGGRKGLIVNSVDLCKSANRAISHLTGHNGKVSDTKPVLKAKCPKARKGKKSKRAR